MSFTYLDEDLPEIEITELITADEDVNTDGSRKTGINTYSPNEIYEQLLLLLKSIKSIPVHRKASAFQKLHADIIAEKIFALPDNIIPEVSIQRKDNGDYDVFFEDYDEAHKIKRYDTRNDALLKAFIGFETTNEDEPVFPENSPNTTVFIKDTNKNMTVILPHDDLTGTITKLFTKIYSNENITLVDKINLIISISETEYIIDPSLSLEENISRIIPTETKTNTEDIKKEPIFKNLQPTKNHKSIPLKPLDNCSIHGFYIIQKQIFEKLQPVLQKFKDELIDIYYAFIDSNVNQPEIVSNIPNNAFDIALMLLEKQTTIEEVTNTIKARIFLKQREFIEEWYAFIESWNIDDIFVLLSNELELSEKTLHSIEDEPYEEWISINEEIKYIKRGEVISKEFVEKTINETTINDADLIYDEDEEEIPPIYEDVLPVDITHLDEGTRELYEIVLKMFVVLKTASGLQLDYDDLTKSIPTQIRRTKSVEPITDAEFIKQLQYQWTYLLAWWICNLQEKVLSHRLQFKIWEGYLTCIDLWSPYGSPMEKPQKEGIIPYLLCVIHQLMHQEGTLWKKYTNGITTTDINNIINGFFSKEFKDTVTKLQFSFKTFEKDLPLKNLIKKGIDIKDKLSKTVKEKNKENFIKDYMSYLKNLPAVLAMESSNKLRSGCCLQRIYDINNEKATYFKNAYKLKQLFATERIGFEKRPPLMKSGLVKTEEVVPDIVLQHNIPEQKEYEEWNVEEPPDVSEIEKIIDIIGKTTTIDTSLKDFIFKKATTHDLLQVIIKLSQIQYLQIQTLYKEAYVVEYEYLIEEFKFNDYSHNHVMNELQSVKYLRILQHHLVTQMCFPAKPQNARNNTLVLLNDGLDASLLKNFVKHSIREIEEWVFNKTFNTSINYTDYISKEREKENISKISLIDAMSPEERQLYVEAKKLGILELQEFMEQFREKSPPSTGEEEHYEYENPGENDDQTDDESLNDI